MDWSRYGVFQYLLTNGSTFAPTFVNAAVGQTIFLLIQQASSASSGLTLPTGTILAGTAAASITLTGHATNNAIDCVRVTCTAPGVYLATLD